MDLTTKTPAELTQLSEEIKAELLRRQNAAVVDREIGKVLERARENGATETPEQGDIRSRRHGGAQWLDMGIHP